MVKVAVLAALAFAAIPGVAVAQTPAPAPAPAQAVSPPLPRDLFEPLPSAPPPRRPVRPAVRDRDRLLVGSALAMLAVAASTALLVAQTTRVRRELLT